MEKPLLDTHMKTIPIGLSSSHIEAISKYSLPEITSVCILLLYSFSRFTTESIYYNYQEHCYAGGCLDHKGLHGKDDALLPAAGLKLAVIHTVGKEQGGQHGQHPVAGEHDNARDAQQGKAVGKAGQAKHQQRAVAAQRQHKAQMGYLRTAELFAQQGVKHHHAKDLRRTAHGGKQGVGGFPACTAKVVFEEIDDEVGGKVQRRVDQHDAAYHYHSLIVAEQGGEHLLYGGGLHLTGGGFFHGHFFF